MDGINSCLFLIPVVVIVSFVMFIFKRRLIASKMKFISVALLWLYAIIIFDKTFFPLPLSRAGIEEGRLLFGNVGYYNIIPLSSTIELFKHNVPFSGILMQLGGNIALFIPLGFILIWIYYIKERTIRLLKTFLICVSTSISIEILQLVLSFSFGYAFRYSDIDDIILNTIGGIIGSLLFIIILPLIRIAFKSNPATNVSATKDNS